MSVVRSQLQEAPLLVWLEGSLPIILGRPQSPLAIDCERSNCSSSYECDLVTVRLGTGETLRIFVKDFGTILFPKPEAADRRNREIAVYRRLLSGAGLDTAEYYGTLHDEASGRFLLLLEAVDGQEVRYCEVEHWLPAAAWLGRLEGWSASNRERLRACSFLVRHDAAFFREKGERALRKVREMSAPLAARLAELLDGYDELADLLAGQPQTLVHGSYRAANILINIAAPRVCPVDWEMAAFGSALYDLAFLVDGFHPPVLNRLIDAYREEAKRQGLVPPGRKEAIQIVNGFRFFMRVHLLSQAGERGLSTDRIARAIDLLEEIPTGLRGRNADG